MRKTNKVIAILIASLLVSSGALVISLVGTAEQGNTTADALFQSSVRTCQLIRGILLSFHTPRGRASAQFILRLNPELANCQQYARSFR